METKETIILKKTIEDWITRNIELVVYTQKIAKKIQDYGLIDSNKNLPFQIFPTELFDPYGRTICNMFVYLDHPMYGFFAIQIDEKSNVVSCSNLYKEDELILNQEELESWIDSLNTDMEPFYRLNNAAEKGEIKYCELFLNDLLKEYSENISEALEQIKQSIDANKRIAIISNNFYSLVVDHVSDYSLALLLPSAWVVFDSLDNLPEEGEDIKDYVNDDETEELYKQLCEFTKLESYLAAEVYMAQRICLQYGLRVKGISRLERIEKEAFDTEESGEFVLPPIDTNCFVVEK